jgi:hypothetical protein
MDESRRALLPLAGALAAIYAAVGWLVLGGVIARAPAALGAGATFDLTLTAALATWWLGSHKGHLPRRAPLVVLAVGLIAARLLLPANARDGWVVLRGAWAAVEIGALAIVGARLGRIRRSYRTQRLAGAVHTEALEAALAPHIGALTSRMLVTELDVLGHALLGWRRPTPAEDARTFSMHRRSHYAAIVGLLVFLILGESVAVHLVLARLSHAAAWLATLSSLWASLWLVGDVHALRLHPLRLGELGLEVRVGIRWQAFIAYADMTAIELAASPPRGPTTLAATVAGAADVRITTARPLQARGLLGRRRRFEALLLSVDRPAELVAAMAERRARLPAS